MKRILLSLIFIINAITLSHAAPIVAIADGSWTNTAVWNLGRVPDSGDDITIPAGRTVTTPAFTFIDLTGPEVTTIDVLGTLTTGFLGGIDINGSDGDLVTVGSGGVIDGLGAIWFLPTFDFIAPFFLPGGQITGPATLQNGTLPIELSSFKLEKFGDDISVQWVTSTEENNDYFEILRSKNGITYEVVGKVDGVGNSTSSISYEYLDKVPYFELSYYKLRQVDYDGKSETFGAKSIYIQPPSELVFYPNPVDPGSKLQIFTNAKVDAKVEISLIDVTGITLSKRELNPNDLFLQVPKELMPGVYFISVNSDNLKETKRLIIK